MRELGTLYCGASAVPRVLYGHRERRGARDGRAVGLYADDRKTLNAVERRFCQSAMAGPTLCHKHTITYRAAVLIPLFWTGPLSDTL